MRKGFREVASKVFRQNRKKSPVSIEVAAMPAPVDIFERIDEQNGLALLKKIIPLYNYVHQDKDKDEEHFTFENREYYFFEEDSLKKVVEAGSGEDLLTALALPHHDASDEADSEEDQLSSRNSSDDASESELNHEVMDEIEAQATAETKDKALADCSSEETKRITLELCKVVAKNADCGAEFDKMLERVYEKYSPLPISDPSDSADAAGTGSTAVAQVAAETILTGPAREIFSNLEGMIRRSERIKEEYKERNNSHENILWKCRAIESYANKVSEVISYMPKPYLEKMKRYLPHTYKIKNDSSEDGSLVAKCGMIDMILEGRKYKLKFFDSSGDAARDLSPEEIIDVARHFTSSEDKKSEDRTSADRVSSPFTYEMFNGYSPNCMSSEEFDKMTSSFAGMRGQALDLQGVRLDVYKKLKEGFSPFAVSQSHESSSSSQDEYDFEVIVGGKIYHFFDNHFLVDGKNSANDEEKNKSLEFLAESLPLMKRFQSLLSHDVRHMPEYSSVMARGSTASFNGAGATAGDGSMVASSMRLSEHRVAETSPPEASSRAGISAPSAEHSFKFEDLDESFAIKSKLFDSKQNLDQSFRTFLFLDKTATPQVSHKFSFNKKTGSVDHCEAEVALGGKYKVSSITVEQFLSEKEKFTGVKGDFPVEMIKEKYRGRDPSSLLRDSLFPAVEGTFLIEDKGARVEFLQGKMVITEASGKSKNFSYDEALHSVKIEDESDAMLDIAGFIKLRNTLLNETKAAREVNLDELFPVGKGPFSKLQGIGMLRFDKGKMTVGSLQIGYKYYTYDRGGVKCLESVKSGVAGAPTWQRDETVTYLTIEEFCSERECLLAQATATLSAAAGEEEVKASGVAVDEHVATKENLGNLIKAAIHLRLNARGDFEDILKKDTSTNNPAPARIAEPVNIKDAIDSKQLKLRFRLLQSEIFDKVLNRHLRADENFYDYQKESLKCIFNQPNLRGEGLLFAIAKPGFNNPEFLKLVDKFTDVEQRALLTQRNSEGKTLLEVFESRGPSDEEKENFDVNSPRVHQAYCISGLVNKYHETPRDKQSEYLSNYLMPKIALVGNPFKSPVIAESSEDGEEESKVGHESQQKYLELIRIYLQDLPKKIIKKSLFRAAKDLDYHDKDTALKIFQDHSPELLIHMVELFNKDSIGGGLLKPLSLFHSLIKDKEDEEKASLEREVFGKFSQETLSRFAQYAKDKMLGSDEFDYNKSFKKDLFTKEVIIPLMTYGCYSHMDPAVQAEYRSLAIDLLSHMQPPEIQTDKDYFKMFFEKTAPDLFIDLLWKPKNNDKCRKVFEFAMESGYLTDKSLEEILAKEKGGVSLDSLIELPAQADDLTAVGDGVVVGAGTRDPEGHDAIIGYKPSVKEFLSVIARIDPDRAVSKYLDLEGKKSINIHSNSGQVEYIIIIEGDNTEEASIDSTVDASTPLVSLARSKVKYFKVNKNGHAGQEVTLSSEKEKIALKMFEQIKRADVRLVKASALGGSLGEDIDDVALNPIGTRSAQMLGHAVAADGGSDSNGEEKAGESDSEERVSMGAPTKSRVAPRGGAGCFPGFRRSATFSGARASEGVQFEIFHDLNLDEERGVVTGVYAPKAKEVRDVTAPAGTPLTTAAPRTGVGATASVTFNEERKRQAALIIAELEARQKRIDGFLVKSKVRDSERRSKKAIERGGAHGIEMGTVGVVAPTSSANSASAAPKGSSTNIGLRVFGLVGKTRRATATGLPNPSVDPEGASLLGGAKGGGKDGK